MDTQQRPDTVRDVSRMQWQVARAVLIDGATDEIAAQRLGVELSTVKTHLKRLFARLDMENRTALAVQIWSGRLDLHSPEQGSLRAELERALRQSAA